MDQTLTGVLYEDDYIAQRYYPTAVFHYIVHIPADCEKQTGLGLIVTHDFLYRAEVLAAEYLQKTGEMPPCVTIAVASGVLRPPTDDGYERSLRVASYDISTRQYADFLVEELLPYLTEKYALPISTSPDMHMVTGGSSGGISAWNIAWYRNDRFHRVYAASPTFSAAGNGEIEPWLIRKTEPRPIRIFTDYAEFEPDFFFGNSLLAAQNFIGALQYAGYTVHAEYHPGEKHVSRWEDPEHAVCRMRYLWKDWKNTPVTVEKRAPTIEKLLPADSVWRKIEKAYEISLRKTLRTAAGTYTAEHGCIRFADADGRELLLADQFSEISAMALSCDRWRLYIGDRMRRCVYAATLRQDGTFAGIQTLGICHVAAEFREPGVFDLCVSDNDIIFAATEIGIQCMRSSGLTDVILRNPDDIPVERIALDENGMLYAQIGHQLYARPLNGARAADPQISTKPIQGWYTD